MNNPSHKTASNEPIFAPAVEPAKARGPRKRETRGRTCAIVLGVALAIVLIVATVGARAYRWAEDAAFGCAGNFFEMNARRTGQLAIVSDRAGNPEIYVINADGSRARRITNHPAGDFNPAWSPDGTRIAFYSERDGNAEIYVVNADGSGLTRLTRDPADDFDPSWSPDGTRIAFHSHRFQGAGRIYVMRANGSNVQRITDPAWDDWSPVWSPDGKRIVFNSSRGNNREIWVMNADGTRKTNVTQNGADDWWPDWSPDGSRVVFHSDRDGGFEVYSMLADGDDVVRLTEHAGLDYGATWSPDGTRIAFTADLGGNREVCLMNADGSGLTAASRHRANDWAAAWRPETGTELAGAAAQPPTAPPTSTLMHLPTRTPRPAVEATGTFGLSLWGGAASATSPFPSSTRTVRPPTSTATARPPTATRIVGTLPSSGNLALNQYTTTSKSESARPASRAVDGSTNSDWGSGDFPPQWIQVDLGAPARITEIRLLTSMYPNGTTDHRILVGAVDGELRGVHRFEGYTYSGQWLAFVPEEPLEDVQFVRIITVRSPSWVGWVEIEVIGER